MAQDYRNGNWQSDYNLQAWTQPSGVAKIGIVSLRRGLRAFHLAKVFGVGFASLFPED
jgi:hypothetical protein